MDPSEDIIDVLYKDGKKVYGFEYQHPPSRNYYEDLYTIQRRNFHGSDSIYQSSSIEKRPLCRTDSGMYQVNLEF